MNNLANTTPDISLTPSAPLPANLEASELASLGLTEADAPEIEALAQQIDTANPLSVAQFGRAIAEETSGFADDLLSQVRSGDLDDSGKKLLQVVSLARSLNLGALSDNRSRIPVVGALVDRFKKQKGDFLGQFQSAKDQIDTLVTEVSTSQEGLSERNMGLEASFASVKAEYRLIGIHIAAGKKRLKQLSETASAKRLHAASSPAEVQALADLDSTIANLDKRVGDLQAMQQMAFQTLPQIRLIQANNRMLIDKFHTVKELTVPTWKRQFMLALSLNEQRNAVELATSVDDATNALLRRNAELLHRNSVEAAKANQRLVIDVDTLKEVQTNLIKTVEDVIKIHKDGAIQRRAAEKQIESMRVGLANTLARRGISQKQTV